MPCGGRGRSGEARAAATHGARTRDGARTRAALRVASVCCEERARVLEAAAVTLRDAIAEAPSMFRAHEALVEVYGALQDEVALEQELERALAVFEGGEWRLTLARLGETLLARGRGSEALVRTKPLLDELEVDEGTLELLERCRRGFRISRPHAVCTNGAWSLAPRAPSARARSSGLGEFLHERMHDPAPRRPPGSARRTLGAKADENSEPERCTSASWRSRPATSKRRDVMSSCALVAPIGPRFPGCVPRAARGRARRSRWWRSSLARDSAAHLAAPTSSRTSWTRWRRGSMRRMRPKHARSSRPRRA